MASHHRVTLHLPAIYAVTVIHVDHRSTVNHATPYVWQVQDWPELRPVLDMHPILSYGLGCFRLQPDRFVVANIVTWCWGLGGKDSLPLHRAVWCHHGRALRHKAVGGIGGSSLALPVGLAVPCVAAEQMSQGR